MPASAEGRDSMSHRPRPAGGPVSGAGRRPFKLTGGGADPSCEVGGFRTAVLSILAALLGGSAPGGHPLGVPVPAGAGLPAPGGRLTCLTCHLGRAGGRLRVPAPALCRRCHSPAPEDPRLFHALAAGRAHPEAEPRLVVTRGALDAASLSCLGCHDGSAASAAGVRLPGEPPEWSPNGRSLRHPIGARDRGAGSARAGVPAVGCTSCHDPWSSRPALLPAGGRLCQDCHAR